MAEQIGILNFSDELYGEEMEELCAAIDEHTRFYPVLNNLEDVMYLRRADDEN